MRSHIPRAQSLATRSLRNRTTTLPRRTFAQTTRPRNQLNYEPPSPKDSKGNDARLSRFSKLLGVGIGVGVAFGYSVYKHKNKSAAEAASLGPGNDGFIKYRMAGREDVSSTCAIFTLRPALGSKGVEWTKEGDERAIKSVLFKQPQLQIARAYTLLPKEAGQPDDEMRFLIRKEKGGEVSSYLHRLENGAEVEVRGPNAEYVMPENVSKVVFLAGGTGIAPALQAAKAVSGEADVHILWANRRREDCEGGKSDTVSESGGSWGETIAGWFSPFSTPGKEAKVQDAAVEKRAKSEIVRRLEAIKRDGQGKVAIDYFVDEEERFIKPIEATTLVRGAFSMEEKKEGGKNVLFVSGPEGFVNAWAGPKVWKDGVETPGPLGGALAKLDLREWEIVKL